MSAPSGAAECVVYWLRPGCAEAYDAHHARVWPEVVAALRWTGITDYTIHRRRDLVIAFIRRDAPAGVGELPEHVRRTVAEWDELMAPLFLPHDEEDGAPLLARTIFDIGECQYARDVIGDAVRP